MTINELKSKLNAENGNLSGVYKITRKADGRVYIGQSENITDRIISHINNVRATSDDEAKGIDAAIQRDGWEAFDYEVLVAAPELNAEQLWLLESTRIAKYDSCNNGFNKTRGNHVGKFDHAEFVRKHVVSVALVKEIRNQFRISFEGKQVLLINLFDQKFIDKLKFDDCTLYYINRYTEDQKELGEYIMEELKKMEGKHFDLIIANPPYGKIGANITKKIIDTVDFNDYVNLLPANDYKRNDTHDLFKYVELDTMKPVNGAFTDAAVTTHMARITKKPHTYISWEEFQIENYTDESLKKYFYEERERANVFNDQYLPSREMMLTTPIEQSMIFTKRDVSHKHLPYSKKTNSYKWNVEQSVDGQFIIDNTAVDFNNTVSLEMITFDSTEKRNNFSKFIYSVDGFRFISKLFTAINCDSRFELTKVFPKVDWTREWTVEEILKDYDYTAKEIQEVMDDLVNFKGMED